MILIDTNVLVYAVQEETIQHDASRRLVEAAADGRVMACLLPQILLEFLAVISDKRRTDNPALSDEASELAESFAASFAVLHPSASVFNILISLIKEFGVRGQHVYDCHLVAQMIDCGIDTICTYNLKDFDKYPILARTPDKILSDMDGTNLPIVQDKPLPTLHGRIIGSLSRAEIYEDRKRS